MKPKNRRGIFRPRYVAADDPRGPMLRLLIDCDHAGSGQIEVDYDEQWRTFFKARRLGLIDESGRITEKGKEFRQK